MKYLYILKMAITYLLLGLIGLIIIYNFFYVNHTNESIYATFVDGSLFGLLIGICLFTIIYRIYLKVRGQINIPTENWIKLLLKKEWLLP